jgi:uncharacterized RDD family membrane protein YckC
VNKGEKELFRESQELICPKCGEPYTQGDTFCTSCGETLRGTSPGALKATLQESTSQMPQMAVADDGQRFWAFVIDLIIIGIISGAFGGILGFTTEENFFWNFGPFYLVGFVYYMVTELLYAQTIGKMALGTQVVDQDTGAPVTGQHLAKLAINNFGKAFLFPIDVILGWLLADSWKEETGIHLKQRFFQRMAGLVVVKKVSEPTTAKFVSSD